MRHQSEGVALITVLLVMTAVAVLAFGTVFTTQIELRIARNDATFTQANYAAQTGLEKYKTGLFQSFRWLSERSTSGSSTTSGDACSDRFNQGLNITRTVDADGNPVFIPWQTDASGNTFIRFSSETVYAADGTTAIGEYTVWIYRDTDVDDYYIVRSEGRSSGATATVEAVVEASTGGVLANAVFAGVGGGNDKFNGGATIRGGVYIFGEGDELTDPTNDQDAPVFDTNGNFAVYNDYNLNGVAYGDVASRVASPSESQLCASFRIFDGQLDLGSSAVSLGAKSNPLLGVYVDDGVSDILTRRNTDVQDSCKQNGGVCANNIGAFDLDEPPALPKLRSSTGPGTTVDDPLCSADPPYWEDCIREGINPGGLTSGFGPGQDLSFSQCVNSNVVSGTLVFGSTSFDCKRTVNGRTFGFSYDGTSTPATFVQHGDLVFTDVNVRFAKNVEYSVSGYEGTNATSGASFAVLQTNNTTSPATGGDLIFDGSFLASGSNVWPNQVISVIAENEVRQRGDHVMAQVYAGYRFRTEVQNVLYGQVITDEYCTTSAGRDECNAGQSSEVVYLNPGNNSPRHFRNIDPAGGGETFRVLSYNLR